MRKNKRNRSFMSQKRIDVEGLAVASYKVWAVAFFLLLPSPYNLVQARGSVSI